MKAHQQFKHVLGYFNIHLEQTPMYAEYMGGRVSEFLGYMDQQAIVFIEDQVIYLPDHHLYRELYSDDSNLSYLLKKELANL